MVQYSKPLVVARIRPRKAAEVKGRVPKLVFASQEEDEQGRIEIFAQDPEEAQPEDHPTPPLAFQVTHCFDDQATNGDVYSVFSDHFMSGFNNRTNITLFAYGESGSGKTFTMSYIMKNFIAHMIETVKPQHEKLTISLSMVEIDNEKIYDLMAKKRGNPLQIVNYEIKGCLSRSIETREQIEPTLDEAWARRKVEATEFNDVSSRSHAVSTVTISATTREGVSFDVTCHIIDLAGSEYTGKAAVEGNPNKSLSLLQLMVRDIVSGKKPQGFRSSKLTHLLQPSLMGQCKLGLVFTLNPCSARGAKATSTFAINTMKMPAAKIKQNAVKMSQAQLQQASEALMAKEAEARAQAEEERGKMLEVLKKNERLEAELKSLHDAHSNQADENAELKTRLEREKTAQRADVQASAQTLLVFLSSFRSTVDHSKKELQTVRGVAGKRTLQPQSLATLTELEGHVQVMEDLLAALHSDDLDNEQLTRLLSGVMASMQAVSSLPQALAAVVADNQLSMPVGPASTALRAEARGQTGGAANVWADLKEAADGQELRYIVEELKGKAKAAATVEQEEIQLSKMIAAQDGQTESLERKLAAQQAEIEALRAGTMAGSSPVRPALELLECLMLDIDAATTVEALNAALLGHWGAAEGRLSLMPNAAQFNADLTGVLSAHDWDAAEQGFRRLPTKTTLKTGLHKLSQQLEELSASLSTKASVAAATLASAEGTPVPDENGHTDKMLKRLIAAIPYQGSFEKIQVLFSMSLSYVKRFYELGGVDRICSECFNPDRNSTWHAKAAQFIPNVKHGPSRARFRELGSLPFIADLLQLPGGQEEDIKRIYACRAVQALGEDDPANKAFFAERSVAPIIDLINSSNQEVQEAAAASLAALAKESVDAKKAIEGSGGMRVLLNCLTQSNIYTQLAAMKTIGRIVVGNPQAAAVLGQPLESIGVAPPAGLDPAVGLALLVGKASTNNRVLQNAAMQAIFNSVEDCTGNLAALESICQSGRFPIDWPSMHQLLLRSVAYALLSSSDDISGDTQDAHITQTINQLGGESIRYYGALGVGRWQAAMAGGRDAASHMYYRNPQWSLEVTETATLSIVLEKGQDRCAKKAFLQLDLYEAEQSGNHEVNFKNILADSGTAYEDKVTLQVKLDPGAYVIVASHSVVGRALDYQLAVVADGEFELDSIPYLAGWNADCSGTVGYGAWSGFWAGDGQLTGPAFWKNPQFTISLDEAAMARDGMNKDAFLKSIGSEIHHDLIGDDDGSVNVIVDVHTLEDNSPEGADNRIRMFAIQHKSFDPPERGGTGEFKRYVGRIHQSKSDKQNHVEDSIYWTGTRKLRTAAVIRLKDSVVLSVTLHNMAVPHPEKFAVNIYSPWPITVKTITDEMSWRHVYRCPAMWDLHTHAPTTVAIRTHAPLPADALAPGAVVPTSSVAAMCVVDREDLAWCVRMNINAVSGDTDDGILPGKLELVSLGAVGRVISQGANYQLSIDPLGCEFKRKAFTIYIFSEERLKLEGAPGIEHEAVTEPVPFPAPEEVAMGEVDETEVELDGMLSNQLLEQANDLILTLKSNIAGLKMREEYFKAQVNDKARRIEELEGMHKGRSHELAINFIENHRASMPGDRDAAAGARSPSAAQGGQPANGAPTEADAQAETAARQECARLQRCNEDLAAQLMTLQQELCAAQMPPPGSPPSTPGRVPPVASSTGGGPRRPGLRAPPANGASAGHHPRSVSRTGRSTKSAGGTGVQPGHTPMANRKAATTTKPSRSPHRS